MIQIEFKESTTKQNGVSENLTLFDVYPPSYTGRIQETFHFTGKARLKRISDTLLIPLPRNVIPVHYNLQVIFQFFHENDFSIVLL